MAKTYRMPGRAASGGAVAQEPPRATGVGPQSHGFQQVFFQFYFEIGRLRRPISNLTSLTSLSDLKSDV